MSKRELTIGEVTDVARELWDFVERHPAWRGPPIKPKAWDEAEPWFKLIQMDLARHVLERGYTLPPDPTEEILLRILDQNTPQGWMGNATVAKKIMDRFELRDRRAP